MAKTKTVRIGGTASARIAPERKILGAWAWMGTLWTLMACTTPDVGTNACVTKLYRACGSGVQTICLDAFTWGGDIAIARLWKRDVDVLFVVDNSPGMAAKQRALLQALPPFVQRLEALGTNYHLGVVSTNVGSVPPGSSGFTGSSDAACNTVSGDDGALQRLPCSARLTGVDPASDFAQACTGGANPLCPDPSFVPTEPWVSSEKGVVNVNTAAARALPPGLAATRALQCIGLLGESGCTVESPLEAMKRAFDGHLPGNRGFLRENSTLVVIFLTDEDDCSVQLAQRAALNPKSVACDPQGGDSDPSCFNLDYRCLARAVQCDESMATPGTKHGCQARVNNFLDPIAKYAKFLYALRPKDRLILAGIWSPSNSAHQAAGYTGDGQMIINTTVAGDNSTPLLNRAVGAAAACHNPDTTLTTNPDGYYGLPQLRLSAFMQQFDPAIGKEANICDVAGYRSVLGYVTERLERNLVVRCLPVRPTVACDGQPDCVVGDVDASQPDAPADRPLPTCTDGCCQAWASADVASAQDAGIVAACRAEPVDCYCAAVSSKNCLQTAVLGVWRAGQAAAPAGTVVSAVCRGVVYP